MSTYDIHGRPPQDEGFTRRMAERMHESTDQLREGSAALGSRMSGMAGRASDHPVMLAVIGAGMLGTAAWFAYTASRDRAHLTAAERRGGYDPFASESYESEQDSGLRARAAAMGTRVTSRAQDMQHRVGEGVHHLQEQAGQRLGGLRQRMRRRGQGGAAYDTAYGGRYDTGGQGGGMEHGGEHERTRQMRERAQHMREAARARASNLEQRYEDMVENQPLVLGLIGFGIGALIGAALPLTRRENMMLGERRDMLLERAKETGREQLHRAEQIARSSLEAAQEQAREEGLTAHDTKEKVRHVAEAAAETAKEETRRSRTEGAQSKTNDKSSERGGQGGSQGGAGSGASSSSQTAGSSTPII